VNVKMKNRVILFAILLLGCSIGCLSQEASEAPSGDVVLTVTGAINTYNAGDSYQFDMETFKSLPYTTISTPDPHLETTIEYGGVLLTDLLEKVSAESAATVTIVAKDGYSATVKVSDLHTGILLAYTADGEDIPEKTGGPIKIIFSEEAQTLYGPEAWAWWVTTVEIS
jgi:hypothetical protein